MSLITINNKFQNRVNWKSGKLCDFNVNKKVHIWQIDVEAHTQHIKSFLQILAPVEIMRANKYHSETDRTRFIISRGSLRHILAACLNISAELISFGFETGRKPALANATEQVYFNVSDSAGMILIAVAGSPVGIDSEFVKDGFNYRDILKNNFSAAEAKYINEDDSYYRFFLLWTRKEAILKATGIGLIDELNRVPSLEGEFQVDGQIISTQKHWQLNTFDAATGYLASIASAPATDVNYWYGLPGDI